MKQVYITAVPLQMRGGLKSFSYLPEGFHFEKNPETCFPIIPVVANTLESAGKATIIAVCGAGDSSKENYNTLINELANYSIGEDQVTVIRVGEFSNQKEIARIMLQLIDAIPTNALVYADITYQTKPVSAAILNVMNLVEVFKHGEVEVDGIYYGEIHRDKAEGSTAPDASLYNLTPMKQLIDMTNQLSALGVTDISKVISHISSLDE